MIYRRKPKTLLDFINKYQVKGYLIFRTAKHTWFRWFLPKGFGHVFAVIERPDHYIYVDTTRSHSIVNVLPLTAKYELQPGETRLDFDRVIDTTEQHYQLSFVSCVEVVKRFLGVNDYFVLTPKQLYRSVKNG